MKNIPQKLYLQIGEEVEHELCDDFNELDVESISWCVDKIFNNDLEYQLVTQPKPKATPKYPPQDLTNFNE